MINCNVLNRMCNDYQSHSYNPIRGIVRIIDKGEIGEEFERNGSIRKDYRTITVTDNQQKIQNHAGGAIRVRKLKEKTEVTCLVSFKGWKTLRNGDYIKVVDHILIGEKYLLLKNFKIVNEGHKSRKNKRRESPMGQKFNHNEIESRNYRIRSNNVATSRPTRKNQESRVQFPARRLFDILSNKTERMGSIETRGASKVSMRRKKRKRQQMDIQKWEPVMKKRKLD